MSASMHRHTCQALGVCQHRTPSCTQECAAMSDDNTNSSALAQLGHNDMLPGPISIDLSFHEGFDAAVKLIVQIIVAVLCFALGVGFGISGIQGWVSLLAG